MKDRITDFIVHKLLKENSDFHLDPDDELLVSGMIDSLGIMLLVNFIRENFGYEVPAQEIRIENFSTVRILTDYLQSRIQ